MQHKHFIKLLWAAVLLLLMTGCGAKESDDPLCGKWAYIHDPQTAVLTLYPSGKAVFQDQKSTWDRSENGIALTDSRGTVTNYRCVEEKDNILFYIPATYTRKSGDAGIVGQWVSENNWSYEFTEKGTFLEDGVLPGHYSADDSEGTIRLAYNDPLEDTLLYFAISGETLYIEYPWSMMKIQ